MSDARKHRLINEAARELCGAVLKLSLVAPDACYYAFEALKEARNAQKLPKRPIPEAVIAAVHD